MKRKKVGSNDFTKPKKRIGKQNANLSQINTINTSVASRKLILSDQGFHEASNEQTASLHHQTLRDSCVKTRHYNPNVRKEALKGIKELFLKHKTSLSAILRDVLESLLPLILDEHDIVRDQVISTMKIIVPLMQKSSLFPFLHFVAAFIATGLSHIQDNVRLTTLDALDIWLATFPELAVLHCNSILPNFLGLFAQRISVHHGNPFHKNQSLTSPSSLLSSGESKSRILSRLLHFLETVVQEKSKKTISRNRKQAFEELKLSFEDTQHGSIFLSDELLSRQSSMVDNQEDEIPIRTYLEICLGVVVEYWIENRSDYPDFPVNKTNSETLLDIIRLMSAIWKWCLQSSRETEEFNHDAEGMLSSISKQLIVQLDKYFLNAFPINFYKDSTEDEKPYRKICWDMNAVFYDFLASFLKEGHSTYLESTLSKYMISLLNGLNFLLNEQYNLSDGEKIIFQSLSDHTITQGNSFKESYWNNKRLDCVLSIMDSVLDLAPVETSIFLLNLLAQSLSRSKNTVISRLSMDFFISNLSNRQRSRDFRTSWRLWVSMIPRHLWELKGKEDNDGWIEINLRALGLFLCEEVDEEFLKSFQTSLIPLLSFHHPGDSSKAPKPSYGPFIDWNFESQKLFCAVIGGFGTITERLMQSWMRCLCSPRVESEIVDCMLDIWETKIPSEFPLSTYLSVLMTLLAQESKTLSKHQSSANRLLRLKGLSIPETIYVSEAALIQILDLKKIAVDIACLSIIIGWLKLHPNLLDDYLELEQTLLSSWMRSFKNYGKDPACQSVCRDFLSVAPLYSPIVLKLIEPNVLVVDNDCRDDCLMKHVQDFLEAFLAFIQDAEVIKQLVQDPECQAVLRLWPSKLKKNTIRYFNLEAICDRIAVLIDQELLEGLNSRTQKSSVQIEL